jgi:hypothetical protein
MDVIHQLSARSQMAVTVLRSRLLVLKPLKYVVSSCAISVSRALRSFSPVGGHRVR